MSKHLKSTIALSAALLVSIAADASAQTAHIFWKDLRPATQAVAEDANLPMIAAKLPDHELRTPLNAILGFSEVMANEVLGPMNNPTYRDYAHDVHESGQHLLDLINEILDLSRIEAGRYQLNEEPVMLLNVVEDCCHMAAEQQFRAH